MAFAEGGINIVKNPPFKMNCPNCGTLFTPNSSQRSAMASGVQSTCFCTRKCYNEYQHIHLQGPGNPHWKGGVIDLAHYTAIRQDRYQSAKYVNEHILIAEEMIGRRLLPNEVVHHKNGNKKDNAPDNLQVMTRTEHNKLHAALRSERRKQKTGLKEVIQ